MLQVLGLGPPPPPTDNRLPPLLSRAADFPPQWMGPLLKAFINWLRFTALAMSVSGVVIGLVSGGGQGRLHTAVCTGWPPVAHSPAPSNHLHPSLGWQGWLVEQNAAGLLAPAVDRAVAAARQPVVLPAAALAGGVLLALAAMLTVRRGKTPVYLLDFECYRPGELAGGGADRVHGVRRQGRGPLLLAGAAWLAGPARGGGSAHAAC